MNNVVLQVDPARGAGIFWLGRGGSPVNLLNECVPAGMMLRQMPLVLLFVPYCLLACRYLL
jgi:hypothetical protein